MTQDLGSDQWFDWQNGLLEKNSKNPGLTADNFNKLLENQALLWCIGKMKPPEEKQPLLIGELQEDGFSTLLLTSRGTDVMDITLKALTENEYDFQQSSLPPKPGFAGEFLPYDPDLLENSGMTFEDVITIGIDQNCKEEGVDTKTPCVKEPRPVKYNHGIFLTAGQNKGAMLRSLLHKTGFTEPNSFKAIVYVDDKDKHVQNIFKAFSKKEIVLRLFHYTHEVERVEIFKNSNKSHVIEKWKKIQDVVTILNK